MSPRTDPSRVPSPRELAKTPEVDGVLRVRSLWCGAYEQCLRVAYERRWRSWSCEGCPFFVPGPLAQDRRAARTIPANSR